MVMDKQFGVAVKALILNKDEFLILKRSSDEEIAPEGWDIPGGRIKHGENMYSALWREVNEETGLDIDIIHPSNVWSNVDPKTHLVGITFFCKTNNQNVQLSNEHTKYVWADSAKILKSNVPKWLKDEIKAVQKVLLNSEIEKISKGI